LKNVSANNGWVIGISGGVLLLFLFAALINMEGVTNLVNAGFGFSVKYFGAYWQLLLLATFIISLVIAVSKYGRVRLGNQEKPEINSSKWLAMIMCTLLAGGGVFWAAAEPMYHFISVPPAFDSMESGTMEALMPALAQAYMHWGFLAWAILGTLSAIVLMYFHYHKGLPLKPRTLLYPIFGERILEKNSIIGILVDAFSIIAVAAGTIGPIGFLGLQASYGMHTIFGVPDTYATQLIIIIGLVTIATISAVTGIHKGIQLLSNINVLVTLFLMVGILLLGPGGFILDAFISSFGFYVKEFATMSTFREDAGWLSWWTVFFWGWFLGYGPLMAIFISRISKGRTIREIILAVAVIAPIVTNFWFTVVGGSGIFYELTQPGSVSNALNEAGLPAAMIAITQQLPFSLLFGAIFLFVTVIFVATTSDSMSYTISVAVSGEENPAKSLRVFWSLLMGTVAAVLIAIGSGGISALQSFIVVTAVPVSLILLPTLWVAPKIAAALAREQGIVADKVQSNDVKNHAS
jgi:glycine betaine transporter